MNNIYLNHSGGAIGADYYWDKIGQHYGIYTYVYSFHTHKIQLASRYINMIQPNTNQIVHPPFPTSCRHILQQPILNIADFYLQKINSHWEKRFGYQYKRHLPRDNLYVMNLLRKNWFQALYSQEIFAIGRFLLPYYIVNGGTGWTIAMARYLKNPIHFFDLETHQWYDYNYSKDKFVNSDIPILSVHFAGIGTRGDFIDDVFVFPNEGKQAIHNVYKKTFQKEEK